MRPLRGLLLRFCMQNGEAEETETISDKSLINLEPLPNKILIVTQYIARRFLMNRKQSQARIDVKPVVREKKNLMTSAVKKEKWRP
ncbi:MAG: hypothetical protein PWQ29_1085 [Verrucomicrobiota bacterium]|nr:hypothetical protein [Verrucomicrobiota bacterium]MDK2963691.1 hypothetical protein [Verrucomicrobiota bacterium]